MVVVMLVAILAMIAVPTMAGARNDRIAFDYARQVSEIVHHARARASGTGSAHLVMFTTEATFGPRGAIISFEALDGVPPNAGPGPASSCRLNSQWNWVPTFVPGPVGMDPGYRARVVDFLNINATAGGDVRVSEDMKMEAGFPSGVAPPGSPIVAPLTVVMLCITPNGTTWLGTGTSASDALTGTTGIFQQTLPFRGQIEIDVTRYRGALPAGLRRRVIIAGSGAPRIRSE
jgi:type II secretory pathway pseudopilin PulG